MIPNELLQTIESIPFAAEIGVVSTPRRFCQVVEEDETCRELTAYLVDPDARKELAARLSVLLNAAQDPAYAHPHDLAMGVYLRLLHMFDPDLARDMAEETRSLQNLWWTRVMAMIVWQDQRNRTRTGDVPLGHTDPLSRAATKAVTFRFSGAEALGTPLPSALIDELHSSSKSSGGELAGIIGEPSVQVHTGAGATA